MIVTEARSNLSLAIRRRNSLISSMYSFMPTVYSGIAATNKGLYLISECAATMGAIRMAMILITLIMGLIAGPAVSLFGSPTVSPVTAAAWVSVPLPP